jgi:hypothetical protein
MQKFLCTKIFVLIGVQSEALSPYSQKTFMEITINCVKT